MAQQEALSILRIGDFVTLKNVKNDEILCAEGILLEDLTLCDKITNIDDCLFCIHLQRQYSASRELEEFLVTNKYDEKSLGTRDPQIEKYYQALKKGANNERKLNDSYMKKKLGQIVCFGDFIQLFHVTSRKYLTILPADLAKDERENIRITLDRTGTSFSWLQVCPRYKIDREGDRIMTNAEVYLKVADRSNEYIHRADRDPPPGRGREVNCSLETTSWKVLIFQSSVDSSNRKNLLASQLVSITDPETRCNLTIFFPAVEKIDDELQVFDGNMGNAAEHELDYLEKEFCHEHGDLILKPPGDYISSDLLWVIETNSHTVGGPVTIKTDKIRLKHMNTNLYLRQIHIEKEDENGEFYDELGFTTTYYPDHDGTLFSLLQTNTNSKYLINGRALQIGLNGVWMERGDVLEDGDYVVKGNRDKLAALNVIFNRYGSTVSDDDQVDTGDSSTGSAEPLDVHVGLSGRLYFRKYLAMTELPKNDSINTLWPRALRTDLAFFQSIVQKFVFFSQGFPISDSSIQLGIDKAEASLRIERQCLLRDQGILEIILRMIHLLIPITEKQEKIKANANKKKFYVSEAEVAVVAMGQSILSKCFDLIFYSVLDNQENQIYVADFMPTLLAHLNTQPLAGKSVTEMLSKNVELQETKIGKEEIQIFIDKLRSSKMNAMYLNLLRACCSCEGDGIDGNQCTIAELLFSNTNDIIIMLNADYTKITPVKWIEGNASEYLSLTPIPGSPIRAEPLLSKGIPHLSLSWTTNSIDFSPLGLFGKLSVSVEELFQILSPEEIEIRKKSKNEKKKQSDDQKRAVANYFIAELFLGAEMGMQRNYIAFHKLDNIFTYDVLITIIKMNTITNDIKSAAVRLLMCLYIDRDPQATTKIPVLTRAWSDVEKNSEPQLPFVDSGRRYIFGLIQQLVSDHIKDMASKRWDDLSRHMLTMLRTLVEFNFYGTIDRMKDVIGPLITAIDRRNVKDSNKQDDPSEKVEEKEVNKEEGDQTNDEIPLITPDNELEREENSGEGTEKNEKSSFFSQMLELCNFHGATLALLSDDSKNVTGTFVNPLRYTKAPTFELETMVEAVDILAFAQRVIEDRNLSLLLRAFYQWENGSDSRAATEIFEEVIQDSKELSLGIADFDNIMLDVLMFVFTPLVQSSLEVLMAHHSKRRSLLNHAKEVQILVSHSRERQFRIVQQMLLDLENNAETQELWGPLETDADRAVSKQTKDILKELIDICRIRRSVLEFDEEFMPDVEIQNLYRNLGCLDICMKVVGLLESIEEDEEEDGDEGEEKEVPESVTDTLEIINLATTLLYWFFLNNEKNQELGYDVIDEFIDTLDEGINSHMVIQALFKGNEYLMKQMPHSYFSDMIEKILKNGKSHHYLILFASVSHVGEKNIMENQLEIVKSLTSPGRFHKLSCYFVPTKHPDYANKVELMTPFLNKRNVTLEDLPPLIAYHLMFLDVLSGCTVGRANLATVEAKVQSIFSFVDVIDAILDPSSILLVKIKLSEFFFNSVVEVELKVPSLEQSPCIWQLMESYKTVLTEAKEDITILNKYGLQSLQVNRQKIEYIITCISIIRGFFMEYYDPNLFQTEDKEKKDKGKTVISSNYVIDVMTFFFDKIKDIYELDSPHLSKDMTRMIYSTLETLSKHIHEFESVNLSKNFGKKGNDKKGDGEDDDEQEDLGEDAEQKLMRRYKEFLGELEQDEDIQYKADNENVAFISLLEKLPFMADPVIADVRYETLIKKLVQHIRENIKVVDNKKQMDIRVTATSCWIVKAFRTMIENKMGMTIYERDEDGGEEQDLATAPVVNALNSCGATALCLDLIAVGIDEKLQLEAIKLGVGLLFKEGGALEVQTIMYNHLNKTNSELFFRQVRAIVQKLQEWHNWNQVIILEEGQEPKPPEELLLLRFLQLMCEGHYLPNQDIMREQPNNSLSCNVLEDFANYLNCLSRIPCRTSSVSAIRLSATVLEVIQGPCVGNQAYFALSTELVETLNRLNRAKLINDCVEEEEIELKKTSIDILQALLEGQGSKSLVYEKILSVIHLDIILLMSKEAPPKEESEEEINEELEEEKVILQVECVVLLQMFCNFRPSLYDELGISRKVEDIVGSGTAMIEVIWRDDIHRRFFHVPRICDYLAKSSKDYLVEKVDRSNAENKLVDFLNRSHDLYKEVKHQQLLTEMKLSSVFSKTNLDRATWFTFILAFSINIVMLFSYSAYSQSPPSIPPSPALAILVLNIIQVIGAFFVLVLNIVVRLPVKYQSLEDSGISKLETILYTALEPLTVYYVGYLVFTILGFINYSFMPFLLLDIIVKNSTVQDVLNAVIFPRNQIMMGGIIILFIMQIYAFFLFMYFRNDMWHTVRFCDTLFNCYLVAFGYGLREGGGVGDVFRSTIGRRWLLDVSFYFVITVGMLNLIAGVIITTFGQLRENKAEQTRDTVGVCFICGIDKQVFDRASTEPEGFKTHVKIDHNMWNYLYFIFLLWEQDKDDDDGMEQYVRRAIDKDEIIWFPMNKAIRLEAAANQEESLTKDLKKKVQQSEYNITSKLDKIQNDVSIALEQLNQVLKKDLDVDNEEKKVRKRSSVTSMLFDRDEMNNIANSVSTPIENKRKSNKGECKELYITLKELSGIDLNSFTDSAGDDDYFCNVNVESGESFTIKGNLADNNIIKFPNNAFKLCDIDSFNDDSRVCTIKLTIDKAGTNETQNVDLVELTVEEMVLAHDSLLENLFSFEDEDTTCKLTLFPTLS